MTNLDARILRIGIEVGDQLRTYDDLAMSATITKTSDAIQNEAQINIANLAKDVRNQLLTETSPYNLNYVPKKLRVEVGRASTGPTLLDEGDIVATTISPPPNIVTSIVAKTLNYAKGRMVSVSTAEAVPLRLIAERVAKELGLNLVFEATDRDVRSFHFDGASQRLVQQMAELGGINVYVDDRKLIVKDVGSTLSVIVNTLTENSGMIGPPELTEVGVRVRFFVDPRIQIGSALRIESKSNPALSGTYGVYAFTHLLASREAAFYTVAECWRPGRMDLTTGIPQIFGR